MSTENRNPKSHGLDRMSASEIVELCIEEENIALEKVTQAQSQISEAAAHIAETYKNGGRIVYVGAGTSSRIALADIADLPNSFGIEPDKFLILVAGGERALTQSVADVEDDVHAPIVELNEIGLNRKDILIGISASGKTPFVLSAIRHANQKGVWTCGITNSPQSGLVTETSLGILLDTGPEIITGATRMKAATAQKLALTSMSSAAMVMCGRVVENLMVDIYPKNQKLKERSIKAIRDLTTVSELEAKQLLEQNQWNTRKVLEIIRTSREVELL